ncbi:MAG: glycosyltransferase [Eubacteriales bacterium]|nr:glycosyltransferase [Eubacteriales bacterium]
MKLLILTCNTGQGHNSCAAAVKEELERRGGSCDIADSLALISVKVSEFISVWHARIYRYAPKAFSTGYAYAENHPALFDEGGTLNSFFCTGAEKLEGLLEAGGYDALLCVHVFPAMMAAELRRRGKGRLPTGFLATDYTCSPSVEEGAAELVFIPHEDLIEEFVAQGIERSRIVVSGIPVHAAFAPCADKWAAKACMELPTKGKNLLLMCGSMGSGPIRELVYRLSEGLKENDSLCAVCGSNARLYEAIEKNKPENVRLFGFTDAVPQLMDAADVFLTKPGGISITEAAAKRLPMVLDCTVDGCEARNLDFFLSHGWARSGRDVEEVARACEALLQDDAARKAAAAALRALDNQGARRICDALTNAVARWNA